MEEQKQNGLPGSQPGEIVEYYRRPAAQEVVETYVRRMPGHSRPQSPPARRKRKKTGLWIFLLCLAVVLVAAAGAWAFRRAQTWWPANFFFYHQETEPVPTTGITIPTYPTGQGVTMQLMSGHGPVLTTQEIYTKVNPSVVTVMAQMRDGISVGTGVIFREDGYILTNYHVLDGGRSCTIALSNNRSFEALYVAGDEENDLAVLKADITGLPAAEFGDSDLLVVGDPVCAICNPLGTELRGTLTDGIVSAINRDVEVDGRTMTLIQTNAALNSGNSGGPLINQYGQVVGINTIKMTSRQSNVEGLGFAIPSATVQYLVNDLLEYGEVQPEPLLGISVSILGSQVEEGVWGIQILEITPGSPADLAGLRELDYIVSAGGQPVTSSQDLLRVRRQYKVGDQMELTIWRAGEYLDVTLLLDQEVK